MTTIKCVLSFILILLFISPLQANTIILETNQHIFNPWSSNQGWWMRPFSDPGQGNHDTNDNYFVGLGSIWDDFHRNFFTFYIPELNEPVISATLELTLYGVNIPSPSIYALFDVVTDAAILNYNVGFSDSIFDDLGSGKDYGKFLISKPRGSYYFETMSLNLSDLAICDINLRSNNYFSIGGKMQSEVYGETRYIFGGSSGAGVQRLILETGEILEPVIPEPSSLLLMGFGVMGLVFRRKK